MERKIRVGIVGYGKLGEYLVREILQGDLQRTHELAFVWNRSPAKITQVPLPGLADLDLSPHALHSLEGFASRSPDLVVEVAHPDITHVYGELFLQHADYLVGSPTAFADEEVHGAMLAAAQGSHALYLPRGALVGLDDILEMRQYPGIERGVVTMKKAPLSIKYSGPLPDGIESLEGLEEEYGEASEETLRQSLKFDEEYGGFVLYDGPLRQLCAYAPNNVNTMATFALASGLSFDRVRARLVAVPGLEKHVVEVEAFAPRNEGEDEPYSLRFERHNPAAPGAVTGNLTYHSFMRSLQKAHGQNNGVHFC